MVKRMCMGRLADIWFDGVCDFLVSFTEVDNLAESSDLQYFLIFINFIFFQICIAVILMSGAVIPMLKIQQNKIQIPLNSRCILGIFHTGYVLCWFLYMYGASLVTEMVKNLPAIQAGHLGLFSGLGRSPGVGNGYALQYSCLENSTDRGVWKITIHGVADSRTRLSN